MKEWDRGLNDQPFLNPGPEPQHDVTRKEEEVLRAESQRSAGKPTEALRGHVQDKKVFFRTNEKVSDTHQIL